MALKAFTEGLYGIVLPGTGTIGPPTAPNWSANGGLQVEAANVTSLNRFDGDSAGVIISDGCRMMVSNAEAPGFVFNKTVAQVNTILTT